MKSVLIYPPIPNITTSTAPPVGLAYLASVLRNKGFGVEVISSDADGLDASRTADRAIGLRPDFVCLSVSTPTVDDSKKIIAFIKQKLREVKVLVGGPHPTLFPEELLSAGADMVIRREGEDTLSELCDVFREKRDFSAVRGISFVRGREVFHNPDRDLIDDLDRIPFPSWELFPVRRYRSDFRRRGFSLPVLSSRGCPAQCTFCYKGIFGCAFRVRSPANIIEEILCLKEKYGVEEFAIIDDSFTSIPKRAMEVCDLIIEKKINLPWSLPAGIRVPTVSMELLRKLKSSGCYRVGLGIESGNQEIIRSISKGITLEQVRRAVTMLKSAGIESAGYFMIGNLEETIETVDQTIRFAVELDCDYSQFTKCTPYPGSAIYETLTREGRIVATRWDDYDSFLKGRPVFRHKNMTDEQIDQKIREAYRRVYLRPRYILKRLGSLGSPREFFNFFRNAVKFLTSYLS